MPGATKPFLPASRQRARRGAVRVLSWALAWCLVLGCQAAQAPLVTRVALVIGNGAYRAGPALVNPVRDASAIGAALKGLGFTVIELHDGTRAQMLKAIDQTTRLLRGRRGLGLLFYAGHGLQQDWHNFMVPVNAQLASAADVQRETVDVDRVIQAFKAAGNRMNIVILDACRDNPFGSSVGGLGLAPLDAPPGTLLAYATAPGNVADDGDPRAGHGLYTQHLLREIAQQVPIEDVFKRVRLHVRQQSQGRQIPWESTSLEEDFSFSGNTRNGRQGDDFALQKADWDRIKGSRNPDDFFTYLQRYPNGYIAEQAAFMLEQLSARATVARPDRAGQVQDPRQPRFRVGDSYTMRTLDTASGREIARHTRTVDRIADGLVFMKGTDGDAVRTLDGGYVRSPNLEGAYRWDPPRLDLPGGEMAVGKRWTGRTLETTERSGSKSLREDSIRIVAQEEVKVPAGTFVAYKFVLESNLANGVRVKRTYWAQPGWGHSIKVQREVYRPNRPPVLETTEMVSRTFGK